MQRPREGRTAACEGRADEKKDRNGRKRERGREGGGREGVSEGASERRLFFEAKWRTNRHGKGERGGGRGRSRSFTCSLALFSRAAAAALAASLSSSVLVGRGLRSFAFLPPSSFPSFLPSFLPSSLSPQNERLTEADRPRPNPRTHDARRTFGARGELTGHVISAAYRVENSICNFKYAVSEGLAIQTETCHF